MTWCITRVYIHDLFGFSRGHEFTFSEAATVFHMPNHNGKSSLVGSVQWALTGQIKNPESVNKANYSILNMHSGERGSPEVVLELVNTETEEMLKITRRGHKEPTAASEGRGLTQPQKERELPPLEIEVDKHAVADWEEGQSLIEKTLGLRTSSLSKCGVVSHSDMTRFVSGKSQDVSDVMNDMLDLGPELLEVAPLLLDGKKRADRIRKQIIAILKNENPIYQWNGRHNDIQQELDELKTELQKEGFTADDVVGGGLTQERIEERFNVTEKELNVDHSGLDVKERVSEIRNDILRYASSDPANKQKMKIERELERLEKQSTDVYAPLFERIDEAAQKYNDIIGEGEIDLSALATELDQKTKQVNKLQTKIKIHENSSSLSTAIIEHLEHHDVDKCPLCGQKAKAKKIRALADAMRGPELTAEISELKSELETANKEFEKATTKYKGAEEISNEIANLYPDYSEFLSGLPEAMKLDNVTIEDLRTGNVAIASVRDDFTKLPDGFEQKKAELETDLEGFGEGSEFHTKEIQPLEDQLKEVERLLDLVKKEEELTRHLNRRVEYEEKEQYYEEKKNRAGDVKMMLHSLHSAIVRSQEEAAREAVLAALPLTNEVYSNVCSNPEYTRLHIDVVLKEDSRSGARIQYHIMADSKIKSLGGQAATRLSDGDLQVANLAILMALASSPENNFSTLLLDDPCSDMDAATMKRWAKAALKFTSGRQLIVLTHSKRLATYLEKGGAIREDREGWESGRLPGHNG